MSGAIDPEIADLMGIESSPDSGPGFEDLFGEEKPAPLQKAEPADYSNQKFDIQTKIEEDEKPFFKDQNYYKNVLSGIGDNAQRMHKILSAFLNTSDPKEKSMQRGKLIAAYWNFASDLAKTIRGNLDTCKLLTLRFGLLHPGIITPEQRGMISKIIIENKTGEPIHYVDEWIKKVAYGEINASATDETKAIKKHANVKVHSQLENIKGQQNFHAGALRNKVAEMESLEYSLMDKVEILKNHAVRNDLGDLKIGYNSEQKQALSDMQNIIRELYILDRDANKSQSELEQITEQLGSLQSQSENLNAELRVDPNVINAEFNTVRQMHKLCVGRQGNHIPILMKNYFRAFIKELGIRENVINELAAVEALDPGVFQRTFKQQTTRIVPHTILVPCYGERGICWEPFERFNKASSRGRMAVPIFSKDLKTAVICACGDLRWQVAKEKAQHYWMEEGLTGRYYQYFTEKKIRGDVKEYFIQDYLLWITKESEGTQKLERDARSVFWRFVPFPQELKDTLRNRGFVYGELYKKDQNRAMSDGY